MHFSASQRHRQTWAIALVLVMLWLGSWGQVHRVLHAGAVTVAAPVAAEASWQTSLQAGLASHEEGGSLCQLLDHLSQGSAPVPALATLPAMPLPPLLATWTPRSRHGVDLAPFEARGPPHLA